MKPSKIIVFFLVLITLSAFAYSLSLSGENFKIFINFLPNYEREDTYFVTNKEGYTCTYRISPMKVNGVDLSPYFVITPNVIENVANGESRQFKVKLVLPDSIDIPGDSESWVRVQIDTESTGVIKAVPSLAIRYILSVLYPYKYIQWYFSAPDMNINETKDFGLSIINLGEPTVGSAYGDIVITDLESGQIVRSLRTQTETDIQSRQSRSLIAKFDATNLRPGNYRAVPTLQWDANTSNIESDNFNLKQSKLDFRIGTKNVRILNFTRLFEYNSINKFDIFIESEWNTKISDIYAIVRVYDPETNAKLKEFKSLNTELDPFGSKVLDAYFDTTDLEKKQYRAEVTLFYEGDSSVAQGDIWIDENINAITFKEMPGTFKLDFSKIFTPMGLMIVLLIIFIIINLILLFSILKNRVHKEKEIDPAVIQHVTELRKKYNDDYIRNMMTKKGWSAEKIEKILKDTKR
jgi:hypothetical protein